MQDCGNGEVMNCGIVVCRIVEMADYAVVWIVEIGEIA